MMTSPPPPLPPLAPPLPLLPPPPPPPAGNGTVSLLLTSRVRVRTLSGSEAVATLPTAAIAGLVEAATIPAPVASDVRPGEDALVVATGMISTDDDDDDVLAVSCCASLLVFTPFTLSSCPTLGEVVLLLLLLAVAVPLAMAGPSSERLDEGFRSLLVPTLDGLLRITLPAQGQDKKNQCKLRH